MQSVLLSVAGQWLKTVGLCLIAIYGILLVSLVIMMLVMLWIDVFHKFLCTIGVRKHWYNK